MKEARYQFALIDVAKADGIATVTLNAPETRNALSAEMQRELSRVWLELRSDAEINIIVLTGAGPVFSAGGDIKTMVSRFGTPDAATFALTVTNSYRSLLTSMLDVNQPVIAAVNGDAIGLGGTIALLCDIGVIAEDARFGDPHIHLGLSAGDGAAAIWPMMIGMAEAKDRILRGVLCSGAEARTLGFFKYVAPRHEVLGKARALAEELSGLSSWALKMSKQVLNKHIRGQLDYILDAALAWEMLTMGTEEHRSAVERTIQRIEAKKTRKQGEES